MSTNAKTTEMRRAMETFCGIVQGIVADGEVNTDELEDLRSWIKQHSSVREMYPVADAAELVQQILDDGEVDTSEAEEFISFADHVLRYTQGGADLVTAEMTELHGFLAGIVADAVISPEELEALRRWMTAHTGARDKWPYDETERLIRKILADGKVTQEEQSEFLAFASSFVERLTDDQTLDSSYFRDKWMQNDAPVVQTVDGLFHPDGIVHVDRARICFTGQMASGTRKEVEKIASDAGAMPSSSVTQSLDYLVIGSKSNPSWAYATYGRKVEKVMEYNKKGADIRIVSEQHFLEAVDG